MTRVLVTGASGFVGRSVCAALQAAGHDVIALVRRAGSAPAGVREWVLPVADFEDVQAHWPDDADIDVVIHLAARVHVMKERLDAVAVERACMATNVQGSLRVARAARAAGVTRFIYLSSIKALGETDPGRGWREDDVPAPADAYGRSKLGAEMALREFARTHQWDVVIVRVPLVYGPGVRANFARLMASVARGVPLPLGLATAPRSLAYVGNVADALCQCATHPAVEGQLLHVADAETLAVRDLIRRLGVATGRPARLIPVPLSWLRVVASLAGQRTRLDRLIEPLRLDGSKIGRLTGWRPPWRVDDGLRATAAHLVQDAGFTS